MSPLVDAWRRMAPCRPRGPRPAPRRGRARRPALAGAAAIGALLLLGCTTIREPALATVRIKAEKDLKCRSELIEIESLWGGRYRAKGCGKVVEYDSVCDGLQCDVSRSGEEAPAWRGRPDPGSFDERVR